MIIKVDKEAESVIKQMCDLSLKAGGLTNYDVVTETLKCIQVTEKETKDEKSLKITEVVAKPKVD